MPHTYQSAASRATIRIALKLKIDIVGKTICFEPPLLLAGKISTRCAIDKSLRVKENIHLAITVCFQFANCKRNGNAKHLCGFGSLDIGKTVYDSAPSRMFQLDPVVNLSRAPGSLGDRFA